MNNKVIKTPCLGICKYNTQNFCIGCKRSSGEITNWMNYSGAMREAIIKDLENREIENLEN
ncbi:hypothetical protein BSPCLSOX_2896 [uncultured Gammaproteobacteria bacterium]|jgi:predicted Fe-S protein YdhL (DUF1289 family)|nr:hypothetical protein BSPCLSOX_2896 [uncultured Gammaproteobacteria bacterium]